MDAQIDADLLPIRTDQLDGLILDVGRAGDRREIEHQLHAVFSANAVGPANPARSVEHRVGFIEIERRYAQILYGIQGR